MKLPITFETFSKEKPRIKAKKKLKMRKNVIDFDLGAGCLLTLDDKDDFDAPVDWAFIILDRKIFCRVKQY